MRVSLSVSKYKGYLSESEKVLFNQYHVPVSGYYEATPTFDDLLKIRPCRRFLTALGMQHCRNAKDMAIEIIETYNADFQRLADLNHHYEGCLPLLDWDYAKCDPIQVGTDWHLDDSKWRIEGGNHRTITLTTLVLIGKLQYQPIRAEFRTLLQTIDTADRTGLVGMRTLSDMYYNLVGRIRESEYPAPTLDTLADAFDCYLTRTEFLNLIVYAPDLIENESMRLRDIANTIIYQNVSFEKLAEINKAWQPALDFMKNLDPASLRVHIQYKSNGRYSTGTNVAQSIAYAVLLLKKPNYWIPPRTLVTFTKSLF